MKRVVILLVTSLVLGLILVSCSSQSCPAYNDYHQYQRETIY